MGHGVTKKVLFQQQKIFYFNTDEPAYEVAQPESVRPAATLYFCREFTGKVESRTKLLTCT